MDSIPDRKDEELVTEADTGLRGQGSVVEMMRRLKEAVLSLDKTSTNQQEKMLSLTRWIMILTLVMAVVGIVQIVLAFWNHVKGAG